MDYREKQKKVKKVIKEFNLDKFIELFKLFASDRINTANNGGQDSISAFIGWIIYHNEQNEK